MIPDTDVMDTWNTSSITPYICYNLFEKKQDPFTKQALSFLPMSMRPQAHDIIRTWAFYTLIKSWMHNKTIPWKEIVISGHVLSDQKEKLSKSKGNNPFAPETLIAQHSADVIRYWTASGSLGQDISFSETQLKIGQRLVTKLWNAFLFAEPHLQGFNPTEKPRDLGVVNEWIVTQASDTFATYQSYFSKHEWGLALRTIEHFFWNDFCDNYIELIKNQIFNPAEYSQESVQATLWSLHHVGLRILQWYAPYLPFVTDAIYQELYRKQIGIASIHLTQFAAIQSTFSYENSKEVMGLITHIVGEVRKLKTAQQLSLKVGLKELIVSGKKELTQRLQAHEQLIKGVTQAEKISYNVATETNKIIPHEEQWIAYVSLEHT